VVPTSDDAHSPDASTSLDADSLDIEDDTPVAPTLDTAALLSGQGDGMIDFIATQLPDRDSGVTTRARTRSVVKRSDYLIAGFPAASMHQAYVHLNYDEGFPAFDNGNPFWGRLDFEPTDAHTAFQRYLLLTSGSLASDADGDYDGSAAAGTRSIDSLITQMARDLSDSELFTLSQKLKEYYHLYYWGLRARSYDLYRVTEYRQKQEIRAIETQDDHYLESRKLRHRLTQYMQSDEEFWDLMTPKTAIDMHKHLTQLERISAGVPASGPTREEGSGGQSFEVAFRTIAQGERDESTGAGIDIDQEGNVLDRALEDPESTKILQELIIRSGGG
jgi:hypothetical protein